MNETAKWLTGLALALIVLHGGANQKAPHETAATAAWVAEDYREYLKRSLLIEETNNSFAASFNVALGYFRIAAYESSLRKIEDIRRRVVLKEEEATLLSKLEAEVLDNRRYRDHLAKRYSYSTGGTLSTDKAKPKDARCDGEARRSRECQSAKLTPEQAQRILRALRGDEIARDYSAVEPFGAP